MSADTTVCACKPCIDTKRFPEAFVIHLAGTCCSCGETQSKTACGKCSPTGSSACQALNRSFVVKRTKPGSLCYEHTFQKSDFFAGNLPLSVKKLTLRLTKRGEGDDARYSVCVVLSF